VFIVGIFAMCIEYFEFVTYNKTYLFGILIGAVILSKNFSENKLPKASMAMNIIAVVVGIMIPVILIFTLYPLVLK
jgi:hypothetical protein